MACVTCINADEYYALSDQTLLMPVDRRITPVAASKFYTACGTCSEAITVTTIS
jgi:hypothetical protein